MYSVSTLKKQKELSSFLNIIQLISKKNALAAFNAIKDKFEKEKLQKIKHSSKTGVNPRVRHPR